MKDVLSKSREKIVDIEKCHEVSAHFNEPILLGTEIGRVIGYAEDEVDCYIVVKTKSRGVYWHTMVGGYYYLTLLIGQNSIISRSGELWNDLIRLDGDLERIGVAREDEFLIVGVGDSE